MELKRPVLGIKQQTFFCTKSALQVAVGVINQVLDGVFYFYFIDFQFFILKVFHLKSLCQIYLAYL